MRETPKQLFALFIMLWQRLGAWLLSLLGVVIAPLIPLGIEAAKNPNFEIRGESILLTAAVLSVGFLVTSEGNWFRFVYGVCFFAALTLDFRLEGAAHPPPSVPIAKQADWLFEHPVYILGVVISLQAVERFIWHVTQDRAFPDWLDNSGK